ncbi:family 71 glycosyl hydrolase [Echria macrotheca]|uniref:Family 71 glycosyl hydrolase n=1 Tax=Echria macrotheca TaxID=438768 RepID=A0AAJ0BGD0_9PEZI|nr:family 71 glycosyl hydrolase [Echria macrotheca]
MNLFSALLGVLLAASGVQSQAVFAHFMVGNTPEFTLSDWQTNMQWAKDVHIEAFALNMAAQNVGFKLLFSFDYAGNGPWPMEEVTRVIQQYGRHSAYWQHQGKPLVSTFEGPERANDWIAIKAQTNCFFIPDWSSLGAGPAMAAGNGVADGLFSWAGWAYGTDSMTTYVDASYLEALQGKAYMMPVSPWFYTNLPGYGKNWAWKGDDLWHARWNHVFAVKPDFVQIISWNDYGESHYIAPLDERQYEPFTIGQAPYNFVRGMPHDGWRVHLPFLIDTYKNLQPAVGQESVVVWYRKSPGRSPSCSSGGTTGNTATQLQLEFEPADVLTDYIFVTALLGRRAQLSVGSATNIRQWEYVPDNEVGVYFARIPFSDVLGSGGGQVTIIVSRPPTADSITVRASEKITSDCDFDITNWNAVVAVGYGSDSSARAPLKLSDQHCIEGWGTVRGGFYGLCQFTCQYGYCPVTACVCTKMGRARELPAPTGIVGYPANGDANYGGLCAFACFYGFCPDQCSRTEQPPFIPSTSPFSPDTCTAGTARAGKEGYTGLCSFSCNWGFCPMHVCQCTATGPLNVPPAPSVQGGSSPAKDDEGLCNFACSRGYCPAPCVSRSIVGHVHFGDSFASGMGTGSTSSDRCRVGSNNYGALINREIGSRFITYQRHSCSGDTLDGLNRQVSSWTNPSTFNVGTITIGGNDLGFGDLVQHCVLRPKAFLTPAEDAALCDEKKQKARSKLADQSRLGIQWSLRDAYRGIVQTAGNSEFQLYVADYPRFFNNRTTSCDMTSFDYWFPGYYSGHETQTPGGLIMLTRDLRTELNDLVEDLNSVIRMAVEDANRDLDKTRPRVHYVPMDTHFEGHRWCESDALPEPYEYNADTWFFLSGWTDFPDDTSGLAGEKQQLISEGRVPVPDASDCEARLGSEPDPYDRFLCMVALNVAHDPNGVEARRLAAANAAIRAGDVNAEEIDWYLPTRQIKTFHPRTAGMHAYKRAVMDAMRQVGQL